MCVVYIHVSLHRPKGLQGATGIPGTTGVMGGKGLKGDPGFRGERGRKGDPGERGIPGNPGPEVCIVLFQHSATYTLFYRVHLVLMVPRD